jgi:hypothetical protein
MNFRKVSKKKSRKSEFSKSTPIPWLSFLKEEFLSLSALEPRTKSGKSTIEYFASKAVLK